MKIIKKKDKKGLTFEINKYIFAPHLEDDPSNLIHKNHSEEWESG